MGEDILSWGTGTSSIYGTTDGTRIGWECKRMTGFVPPSCDSWGPEYITNTRTDEIFDDCVE